MNSRKCHKYKAQLPIQKDRKHCTSQSSNSYEKIHPLSSQYYTPTGSFLGELNASNIMYTLNSSYSAVYIHRNSKVCSARFNASTDRQLALIWKLNIFLSSSTSYMFWAHWSLMSLYGYVCLSHSLFQKHLIWNIQYIVVYIMCWWIIILLLGVMLVMVNVPKCRSR